MNPDPAAPDPAPRRYGLKPRQFIAENLPRGSKAPSADHDVYVILSQVRTREAAAGLGEVAPAPPPPSRRKRDYLLLLIGGNGLMLALFLWQIFLGFQIQCLAAGLPGELSRLFRYALHDGRAMFSLPAACMVGYTVMLSWLMFGVMARY